MTNASALSEKKNTFREFFLMEENLRGNTADKKYYWRKLKRPDFNGVLRPRCEQKICRRTRIISHYMSVNDEKTYYVEL